MFSLFNLVGCYGTFGICGRNVIFTTVIFPCSPSFPLPIKWLNHTVLLWFSSWEACGVGSLLAQPTAGLVLHLALGLPGVSLQQQLVGLICDSLFGHKGLATGFCLVGWSVCYSGLPVPSQMGNCAACPLLDSAAKWCFRQLLLLTTEAEGW